MSRRKTKALLKTLYTGLLIPAAQHLAAGVTVNPTATHYIVLTDAGSAINAVMFVAVAVAAALVHEHVHELDLTDRDTALLRRASRRASELLAARFTDLETTHEQNTDGETQSEGEDTASNA